MRILVTGGAGFIGSHIAEALVKEGYLVRVVDNFSTGTEKNLKEIIKRIELIRGDIRDRAVAYRAMQGVKYVLHQAALRSIPKSIDRPADFNEVNVQGTLNLLLSARQRGIKRFVFASSSSVYGNIKHLPQKETQPPQPVSPYAATKLMGEIYCQVFTRTYQLPTISLRYFNVFGPRQSLETKYAVVVPKFITCILSNKPLPIQGTGKQSRDFTYVSDVVQANLLAIKAPARADGKVYNIACNRRWTILDLSHRLNRLMGTDIKPIFAPPRPGDIMHTQADISLARRYLGYQPLVSFEEGLKRTIQAFQKVSRYPDVGQDG